MKQRLPWAVAAYTVLGLFTIFTLEGSFRLAMLVFLAGLMVKTWIATKRE
jgi:hypothetical protein